MTDRVRSSSPGQRCEQTRSVIAADGCPSTVWTDAPPVMSAEAVTSRSELVLTVDPPASAPWPSPSKTPPQRCAELRGEQPLPRTELRHVGGQLVHHHRAQRYRPGGARRSRRPERGVLQQLAPHLDQETVKVLTMPSAAWATPLSGTRQKAT